MHPFSSHRQWNGVEQVYRKLKAAGFQALLAGGCVRDLIMNRVPNDFDIASDATPDQVAPLFPNALLVGREFGVTIIPFEGYQVEVATFRIDGSYKDGRRPESVTFSTPEEDAKRRDFTVNALFYDLDQKQVVDYVNGEADIQKRIIRAVGEPERRFEEDKLRLLRAVRFAAQLDFSIEPKTFVAVERMQAQVTVVAHERIREEMVKLLKTTSADKGFDLLLQTGMAATIFPELQDPWSESAVVTRTKQLLKGGAFNETDGWLRLLYEATQVLGVAGVDTVRNILKRLKVSNAESDAVLWVLKNQMAFLDSKKLREAVLIRTLAHPSAHYARTFFDRHLGGYATNAKVHAEAKQWRAQLEARSLGPGLALPERLITGDDLQALGFQKGKALGETLEEAFNLQLEGSLKSKNDALAWAKQRL